MQARVSVVEVPSGGAVPVASIRRLAESTAVVALGCDDRPEWRGEAMAAGAFACLSSKAASEDLTAMIEAASRFQRLRSHADEVCGDLLGVFGDSVERARQSRFELSEIRLRIMRTFL